MTNHGIDYIRLLVIRGVDDEASLALAASKLANKLNGLLVRWLRVGGILVTLMGFSILVTAAMKIWAVVFIVGGAASISVVLLIFQSLLYSFFGSEFSLGCHRCEIAVDSAPDLKRMSVVTLAPPLFSGEEKGRRHSIYNNDMCVPAICEWLADNSQSFATRDR